MPPDRPFPTRTRRRQIREAGGIKRGYPLPAIPSRRRQPHLNWKEVLHTEPFRALKVLPYPRTPDWKDIRHRKAGCPSASRWKRYRPGQTIPWRVCLHPHSHVQYNPALRWRADGRCIPLCGQAHPRVFCRRDIPAGRRVCPFLLKKAESRRDALCGLWHLSP